MKIIFQIEHKYENGYILGRLLNPSEDSEFKINLKLSASIIRNIVPADALNNGENQRTDLFVFCLKNQSNFKNLSLGKIVELF